MRGGRYLRHSSQAALSLALAEAFPFAEAALSRLAGSRGVACVEAGSVDIIEEEAVSNCLSPDPDVEQTR